MRRSLRKYVALCGLGILTWAYSVAFAQSVLKPISDERFDRYVKFRGDGGNHGTIATQARVDDVVTRTEKPFFTVGFFRAMDYPSWGMLASTQSVDRNNGTFALSLTEYREQIDLFEWRNGPFHTLAQAPALFRSPLGGYSAAYVLNRWLFVAVSIKDRCNSRMFLEGLWSEEKPPQCVDWPSALSSTTFGSYYDITKGAGDAHVYNGGLRDWAVVTGVPTTEELLRMRNGEDPRAIWGAARVWGFWNFITDPATGAKEPDLTGHGHDLTYIGGGSVDRTKPVLIVNK